MTVVLQAKTDTFLRNIKNAEQTFVGSLDRIENEADQAGSARDGRNSGHKGAFTAAAAQAPGAAALSAVCAPDPYPATGEPAFVEGVCFWTSDGEKIVNYPRQHLDNCTAKNGEPRADSSRAFAF
ncbi:hypothetical protein [Nitratireductor sp. GCM10026969]|uniref:hypothetical protein n=1 Tax=Nitratireductor sp. GCM10026969 TaxID=3252645 RepID=UPI003618FBC6